MLGKTTKWMRCAGGFLMSALVAGQANASNQNLPWEAPIQQLVQSFSGPLAIGISVIGITVAGMLLIFRGEMGDFGRRMCMIVLAVSIVAGATSLFNTFFTTTGALIGIPT